MRIIAVLVGLATVVWGQSRRETSSYTIGSTLQPMVIYGEGWTQQFTIINVDHYDGGEALAGTLRFYTKSGATWRIPINGLGAVDNIPIRLASGQMISYETEISEAPQQLGWALFQESSVSGERGIYHSFSTYRKQVTGRPDLMTSIPFVDDLEDEFVIPIDNRDGKYHGVGLVNSGTSSQRFLLSVYDDRGTLKRIIARQVCAKCLDWFSLSGDYPDLAGFAGQIKMEGPLFHGAAFTLLFAPNGAFMALPVVHTYGLN